MVDTNVFVSAALKRISGPADLVRWVEAYGGLLKSDATEQELRLVLQRPRIAAKLAPFVVENIHRLLDQAELETIVERIAACRDPTDDKFLELAANGAADVIVSDDSDLLVLENFRGIPIVSPAAFFSVT